MAGSVMGEIFKISTWGESHGHGIGVVVDGCPAGIALSEADIQPFLDRRSPGQTRSSEKRLPALGDGDEITGCGRLGRRSPGQTRYSTPRKESDEVKLLSGIFEGRTTGTPISMMVENTSQKSKDYSDIAQYYRPGHADYTFDAKYGFRDYRGGGRSSGRETTGRVAAKILGELGIRVRAYTKQIGPFVCRAEHTSWEEVEKSPLRMPDREQSEEAEKYLEQKMKEMDSAGGIIECVVSGMPAGIGEPVFGKLDAALAGGIFSIGAVKGVEIGAGFAVAGKNGSSNNDEFYMDADGRIKKATNFAGGILGGISDGDDIIIRAAFKPTPSIFRQQKTVNRQGEEVSIQIRGRHDPVIVPRAVVVVEAMTALILVDRLFVGMTSRMDRIRDFYSNI